MDDAIRLLGWISAASDEAFRIELNCAAHQIRRVGAGNEYRANDNICHKYPYSTHPSGIWCEPGLRIAHQFEAEICNSRRLRPRYPTTASGTACVPTTPSSITTIGAGWKPGTPLANNPRSAGISLQGRTAASIGSQPATRSSAQAAEHGAHQCAPVMVSYAMAEHPDFTKTLACAGSGIRRGYVKRIWFSRRSAGYLGCVIIVNDEWVRQAVQQHAQALLARCE